MALTLTQEAGIRRWLGVSDVDRDANLDRNIAGLSAAGEAVAVTVLGRLDTIDTTLASSWGRQKVVRAEEVTLAGEGEIRALRSEGRRLVGELASLLAFQPRRDLFASGSDAGIARRG